MFPLACVIFVFKGGAGAGKNQITTASACFLRHGLTAACRVAALPSLEVSDCDMDILNIWRVGEGVYQSLALFRILALSH